MGTEIERKFLVDQPTAEWLMTFSDKHSETLVQGYVESTNVRIRTSVLNQNSKIRNGYLTIKSGETGKVRTEYEFDIPFEKAQMMIDDLCGTRVIHKIRHYIPRETKLMNHDFTLDVFGGRHLGLYIVEVEFEQLSQSFIEMPNWVISEVTDSPAFYNDNLASNTIINPMFPV
jgi:adenylate cyclase